MVLRQLVLKNFTGKTMFDPDLPRLHGDEQSMNRTGIQTGDSVFSYYRKGDGNRSELTKFGSVEEWHGWDRQALIRFSGQNQLVQVPGAWVQQKALKAYQCAPGVCLADWTCKEGNEHESALVKQVNACVRAHARACVRAHSNKIKLQVTWDVCALCATAATSCPRRGAPRASMASAKLHRRLLCAS